MSTPVQKRFAEVDEDCFLTQLRLEDAILLRGAEGSLGPRHVEFDDEVPPLASLRVGHTLPFDHLVLPRLHHPLRGGVDVDVGAINALESEFRPDQGVRQAQCAFVDQIIPTTSETRMLCFHDLEHDVGGNFTRTFVAFALVGQLRAAFVTTLDLKGKTKTSPEKKREKHVSTRDTANSR